MGLFTYVEVDKELLPDKYKDIKGWQTKDIIEPSQEILIIKNNRKLYHKWYDLLLNEKWNEKLKVSDPNWETPFKQGDEHMDVIEFHGIMNFYGVIGRRLWVDGYAKFTDGLLVNINFQERLL